MAYKSVVIFVHGLGADDKNWWGTTKSVLENNPELRHSHDIKFFNYKTDKIKTLLNDAANIFGLGEVLATLRELGLQLRYYIQDECSQYDVIKLFGHSMGGLIISSTLPELLHHNRLLYKKICDIAFCGTPLGGSSVASVLEIFFGFIVSKHTKKMSPKSVDLKAIVAPLPNYLYIRKENYSEDKIHLTFFSIIEDEVVKTREEKFGLFLDEIDEYHVDTIPLTGKHSPAVINLTANDTNYKYIQSWILRDDENLNSFKVNERQEEEIELIETNFNTFIDQYFDISKMDKINIFAHTGKNTIETIRQHIENYGYCNISDLAINILVKAPLLEKKDRYEQLEFKLRSSINEFQNNNIIVNLSYYSSLPTFQSIILKLKDAQEYIAYISFYNWEEVGCYSYRKSGAQRKGYLIKNPKNNLLFQANETLFNHLFGKKIIHTIIFDFDDTLMDTFDQQIKAWANTLIKVHKIPLYNYIIKDEIKVIINSPEELKQKIKFIFQNTYTSEQRYEYFFQPNTNCEIIEEVELLRFREREKLTLKAKLFDGVHEHIVKLSENYLLTIVSSTTETLIKSTLKKNNLEKYFAIILGRDSKDYDWSLEEKSSKILKVSNLIGVATDRILFIGDSTTDYKASKQLGLKFISVNIIASLVGKDTLVDYDKDDIIYGINTYENENLLSMIEEIES